MNYTRQDQIEENAKAFLKENPRAFGLFCQFTFEAIDKGFETYSAYAICERMRWEMTFFSDTPTEFKLNNNYRPYFARWFMQTYPQFDGFFRLRKLTSKDHEPVTLPELTPADFPYI